MSSSTPPGNKKGMILILRLSSFYSFIIIKLIDIHLINVHLSKVELTLFLQIILLFLLMQNRRVFQKEDLSFIIKLTF